MRCKVGDLCEVIKSIDNAHVGRYVEVISFAGTDEQYGPIWLVKSKTGDLVTEFGGVGDNAHSPDDWLKPVPKPGVKPKVKELEVV